MNRLVTFFPIALLTGLLLWCPTALSQPYVCVETNAGEFCMKMLQDLAPKTVENFLNYVEDGDFNNTMIHRTIPGFIVQGGGYSMDPLGEEIPQDPPIANEFNLSNTRGTVSMAKFPNQLNSATSEWFVNLSDNSAELDFANGGYTAFARIVKGMEVVDNLGMSLRADLSSSLGDAFSQVPVLRKDEEGVGIEDFLVIENVSVVEFVEEETVPELEDPLSKSEQAAEALYQCTADWVSSLSATQVCFITNLGEFCIELFPESAPETVSNFLHYVTGRDYDNSMIHRSMPGFVIQGGGFLSLPPGRQIAEDDPVENEFNRSNTRGTVSMAKLGGLPDSATSQWFVNLADNLSLDTENGGYTVFGQVIGDGMEVVDAIAAQPIFNLGFLADALTSTPLIEKENDNGLSTDDFVTVERAYIPGVPVNPCLPEVISAVAEIRGSRMTLPVRVGQSLYRVILNRQSIPPVYVYTVDQSRIISLADVGQEVAVYDSATKQLTIPSVKLNNSVVTDVVLSLTNSASLEFTLQSFSTP